MNDSPPPGLLPPVPNGEGASATVTLAPSGALDTTNPFFKPQGNGRSCATCHDQQAGWSITPDTLGKRFKDSDGLDPVFRTNDGAVSPNAPVATTAEREKAYAMLLTKGLIRVGLPIPAGAEFELVSVDDPYQFASAAELSLFRRPLPTTNLRFQTALMWDGRESPLVAPRVAANCIIAPPGQPAACFGPKDGDLQHQAGDAIRGHAEATLAPSMGDLAAIVSFEQQQFTAQQTDAVAGLLDGAGAHSGPIELSKSFFWFGINDIAAGDYLTKARFDPNVMKLFGAWGGPPMPQSNGQRVDAQTQRRQSIARGERIFNNRPFTIRGVNGFNDELRQPEVRGTCTSCHSTPNVGTHSVPRLMNTGVSAEVRRTPDLPLYTLRNLATGETVKTTDPGAALQTGKWRDLGKMKVPSLRGLESRSPYFHDGSENDVGRLVRFYDRRFQIGLSQGEVDDLANFLRAL
jgi:cytochrome c peroxidase